MEVIARLETLLMIDDTAANTTFEEHEALLRQLFGELAQQLGRQIERFDYQAALETLRTLKV